MSVKKRMGEASYLDVSTTGSEADWALCGAGFTALTESPSAQTKSKRYINMSSSSQSIAGYEWTTPFEADQIKEEKAISFITNIGKMLLTGSQTERDYVQVDLDEPVTADGSTNVFKARKRKVAIAVSEFPDNEGELRVNGDLLGVSDPIEGTFDTTSRKFTATV